MYKHRLLWTGNEKRILLYISAGILLAAAIYVSLPYYARQALIHLMPVIDDLNTFHRDTVHNTPSAVWFWPHTNDYNRHRLSPEDSAYLDELKTVAFLVIQHDSIVFESYRNGVERQPYIQHLFSNKDHSRTSCRNSS